MRSLKLPFSITPSGSTTSTSDIDVIVKQKIIDILTTANRERVMEPNYGAGIYRFIYEILDPLVFADFKVDALQELNENLSGAQIMDLIISTENDALGVSEFNTTAQVTVYYRIPPLQTTTMTFSVSEFVPADTPV